MIVSVGGGKYRIKSHEGKWLSKPASKGATVKRLREIEYFKHHKGK
jgi:hypothetical protein